MSNVGTIPLAGTKPTLEEAVAAFKRAIYMFEPLTVHRYEPRFAGGYYLDQDLFPLLTQSLLDSGKSPEEATRKSDELRTIVQQTREVLKPECEYAQQLRFARSNDYALHMAIKPLIERKMKPYLDRATTILCQMLDLPPPSKELAAARA